MPRIGTHFKDSAVKIASWTAASTFNEGQRTYLTIMGIKIGQTAPALSKINECPRVQTRKKEAGEQSKEGRIVKEKCLAEHFQKVKTSNIDQD